MSFLFSHGIFVVTPHIMTIYTIQEPYRLVSKAL